MSFLAMTFKLINTQDLVLHDQANPHFPASLDDLLLPEKPLVFLEQAFRHLFLSFCIIWFSLVVVSLTISLYHIPLVCLCHILLFVVFFLFEYVQLAYVVSSLLHFMTLFIIPSSLHSHFLSSFNSFRHVPSVYPVLFPVHEIPFAFSLFHYILLSPVSVVSRTTFFLVVAVNIRFTVDEHHGAHLL